MLGVLESTRSRLLSAFGSDNDRRAPDQSHQALVPWNVAAPLRADSSQAV